MPITTRRGEIQMDAKSKPVAKAIYVAFVHFFDPKEPATTIHQAIASSLDRQSLLALAETINDEVQADYVEIEEYPLIDDYGFPFTPREFPVLRPRIFAELSEASFNEVAR
jgi:hypothetical protein